MNIAQKHKLADNLMLLCTFVCIGYGFIASLQYQWFLPMLICFPYSYFLFMVYIEFRSITYELTRGGG